MSQSPKKRKIATDASTKPKKRRKHDEVPSHATEDNSEPTQNVVVKEKKSKSKSKKKVQSKPDVEMQDDEVVEPPTSQTIPGDEPSQDNVQLNGDTNSDAVEDVDETLLVSDDPTCFYSRRLSLYVPVPAVSLATSTSSLLSLHLAPLVLTYFPPAGGVILSFSDPVLTARAEMGVNLPLRPPISGEIQRHPPNETFAQCADQFGVCWVWLTATFLVFAPQPGDRFKGWANIQSESFIGLVSYNYFQTSVLKNRIPKKWTFDGPSRDKTQKRKTKKAKLRDENEGTNIAPESNWAPDAHDSVAVSVLDGTFLNEDGTKISHNQSIKVNDIDMTPGAERNRFGLQIDGSLLSSEEESAILGEEKRQYDALRKRRSRSQTPAIEDDIDLPMMSGGLPIN